MKCVILQPSYIPWRGYFHQIRQADVFVFYDDVQYDKHGWRNRNRIRTPGESSWLTIPVLTKGLLSNKVPINRIRIDWSQDWCRKHLTLIQQHYGNSPFFDDYFPFFKDHLDRRYELLADLTCDLTVSLSYCLGITSTRFIRSSTLNAEGSKTDRLLDILTTLGATHYLSGPSARDYLEEEKFRLAGIVLEYITYEYPVYPQLYHPFDPYVSILDLLFMTGPAAPTFIWKED